MLLSILVLFILPLAAGLGAFLIPEMESAKYKLSLVFAGSYLFSVTVIHILPELFTNDFDTTQIGILVLAGFFMQQILEYFTSGVEHGHVHVHSDTHDHGQMSSLMLLFAMCLHSFLEGGLLAHPSTIHAHHESNALLFGIVLHKVPAAFALMSILLCQLKKKRSSIIYLVIFTMASPLGLLVSDFFVENNYLSDSVFTILFALVSGNFLHISTTIVFESSVDHKFNIKKLSVAILGAVIAIVAEIFI